MCEHSIIRWGRFASYNVEDWNNPKRLPLGFAGVSAFLASVAIIVPCMSQAWYTGPIAAKGTGDIGLLTGFAVAVILYIPLRLIEKKVERKIGRNTY